MRTLSSIMLTCLLAAAVFAQNIVDTSPAEKRLPPRDVTPQDVEKLVAAAPGLVPRAVSPEADRVAAKLDAHVAEFLAGWPWKALHTTLGISGYEAYFNHPDEMFYCLSIALPCLKPETAAAAKKFLAGQLEQCPPYAVDGFDNTAGRPREAYDVPEAIRIKGRGKAASAFGVYAFWSYCERTGDKAAAARHLPAVRERMKPLIEGTYAFDPTNLKYVNDEAQKLNGDLAGLIGLARLERMAGAGADDAALAAKTRELLALRMNLERVNPSILEPTKSASKHLHNAKLARYSSLVPELAARVNAMSDGLARERVREFREARNGWYMAYVERMTGGENYISPPHMGRAMMTAACFIEDLPQGERLRFVDVPWCKGDFYFIEKCAYALAGGG